MFFMLIAVTFAGSGGSRFKAQCSSFPCQDPESFFQMGSNFFLSFFFLFFFSR